MENNTVHLYFSNGFRIFITIVVLATSAYILKEWDYLKGFAIAYFFVFLPFILWGIFYSYFYKIQITESEVTETTLFSKYTFKTNEIVSFKTKIMIRGHWNLSEPSHSSPSKSLTLYDKNGWPLLTISDFLDNWDKMRDWAKVKFPEIE